MYSDGDFVIVIGRQFGSGGKELGAELSERLGIPCYDKTILNEAACEIGFRKEIFSRSDEKKPSLFRSFFNCNPGIATESCASPSLCADTVYAMQSETISRLAQRGPCIFVGRTADYILRDHPRMVSIFLHASRQERIRRICRRKDASCEKDACELLARRDKERQNYYEYYTGRKWGDAATYDLTLNATGIPAPWLAAVVISYLNSKAPGRVE